MAARGTRAPARPGSSVGSSAWPLRAPRSASGSAGPRAVGSGRPSSARPPGCRRSRPRPSCARTIRSAPPRDRRPHRPGAGRRRRAAAVEEIGPRDAPLTVVFVHGYTLSMASWTFQRRTLAAALATANGHRPDARLVFYDQRGHGGSGRGTPERSTIEQLASDLAVVLESRVPRGPVVLVGHSMGGMTIMGLAALQPRTLRHPDHGRGADLHLQRQLADLNFGLPELLTRVRAAVFPVAAWTMRRRPAFAERTRRVAGDLVSVGHPVAVVRVRRRRPGARALRRRDDRRHPGRRDRGVLSRTGRSGRDRIPGAAAPGAHAGPHRRRGPVDPGGAQRTPRRAARGGLWSSSSSLMRAISSCWRGRTRSATRSPR